MESLVCFSDNFKKRMLILAVITGIIISLSMPLTYLSLSMIDKNKHAIVYSEQLAQRLAEYVGENPLLWSYNVPKFGQIITGYRQDNITTIKVFDREKGLAQTEIIAEPSLLQITQSSPINYNNKIYGYVEVAEKTGDVIFLTAILFIGFSILGFLMGTLLYRFPTKIVVKAEHKIICDLKERKLLQAEVARLDRLSLVGQMAAGIGHEIRNPMTSVRGFLQLLEAKKEYSNQKEIFELMIGDIDRANLIITEFLSLAQNKTIELKPQDLNGIVRTIFPLIQAGAVITNKSVILDLNDIPQLTLDEKEIRQLILNLVRNGLEAMPPGGTLTIQTFVEDRTVVLAVKDKGQGIASEYLDKIGIPFFTTKEDGTGLGLAVCYSIAYRHNAKIKVETGNKGTTFYINFKGKKETKV